MLGEYLIRILLGNEKGLYLYQDGTGGIIMKIPEIYMEVAIRKYSHTNEDVLCEHLRQCGFFIL